MACYECCRPIVSDEIMACVVSVAFLATVIGIGIYYIVKNWK